MERKGNVVAEYSSRESRACQLDADVIDVVVDGHNTETLRALNAYKQIEVATNPKVAAIDVNI